MKVSPGNTEHSQICHKTSKMGECLVQLCGSHSSSFRAFFCNFHLYYRAVIEATAARLFIHMVEITLPPPPLQKSKATKKCDATQLQTSQAWVPAFYPLLNHQPGALELQWHRMEPIKQTPIQAHRPALQSSKLCYQSLWLRATKIK